MINTKKLIITIGYMLVSLILFLCFFYLSKGEYFYKYAGFVILAQFIANMIAYIKSDIGLLDLSSIFTFLNYFFHLSQAMLKSIVREYNFSFDVSSVINRSVYNYSMIYSYGIIMVFSIGVLISQVYRHKNQISEYQCISDNKKSLISKNALKLGLLIFVVSFPIEVYILLSRLFLALESGYLSTFKFDLGGYISLLSNLSVLGIILIFIGLKERKLLSWSILGLYILFYLVTMLSGGRMWQIIKLALVISYFIKINEVKLTPKNISILLLIVYFGSGFLSSIADIRSYQNDTQGYFSIILENLFNKNPLFDIMEELGGTIYTVGLTIGKIPTQLQISHGKQFLTNFIGILPNFTGSIQQMVEKSDYVLQLKVPAIGGSFIGEIFYSFKNWGIIFVFFFGIFIQNMTKKINSSLVKMNYSYLIYTIMFQYSLVAWVRGSSAFFYRTTIYGAVIVYFLSRFILRQRKSDLNSEI